MGSLITPPEVRHPLADLRHDVAVPDQSSTPWALPAPRFR